MKPRVSLRIKVLLLAILNLVLVVAALVWFAQTQLTQNVGNLLLGESRSRITSVATQLGREMVSVPEEKQTELLARYSADHDVTFYLFRTDGTESAGPAVTLPQSVVEYLKGLNDKAPLAALDGIARGRDDLPPDIVASSRGDRVLRVVEDAPFFSAERGYWVIFRMPLRSSSRPGFQPGVLILMSEKFLGTPFFFNLRPWAALAGVLFLIVLACWLPLVRTATHAITSLSGSMTKIARGKFDEKITIQRTDELGRLGDSFNHMANQLEGYVHGQKRFLRDAAHELRSPLSRMQVALANIFESNPGPDSAPFIEAMREEVELMSSLTGELLAFAREENQQIQRKLIAVKFSDTAAHVIATENPHGAADVRVEVEPELSVIAHPESLFRALSNVVRNAIRYAGQAGPVVLAAERRNGSAIVTVTDQGPGIPEESLELIFTPFYRLDDSRNRNTGGNGLGMAIARTCIETCQGTIHCSNLHPGLQVTITLKPGKV